jgi:DeoR/GlpR family transcriptional regulator of sugar metabolism
LTSINVDPPRSTERVNGKERRARTLNLISARGEMSVEELAEVLVVTPSTVRRDLQRLAAERRLTRTLGGAAPANTMFTEPSLVERASSARAEKDAIGRWCAHQVLDGETLILDAGTTTGRLAHHLRERTNVTVITNGMTTIDELANADGVEVVALGGTLRHVSQGFVGPLTDLTLSRLTADRVFLGADGISATRGICEADLVQTRTKELMADRSRCTYVLADSSKLGVEPFDAWGPLPKGYTLVTDDGATEASLKPFREAGINVVTVTVL